MLASHRLRTLTALTILLSCRLLPTSLAEILRNVTVDDTSSLVTYTGTGWTLYKNPSLDVKGGHTQSADPAATATLSFTGIAIYYLAPKFPYQVNVSMSLDGASKEFVDLSDPAAAPSDDGGSASVAASAVWGKTNLENRPHVLVVSQAENSGKYVIVDGFNYTMIEPDDDGSSSYDPPQRIQASTSKSATNKTVIGLAVGLAVAVVASLSLAALFFLFCRRHKRQNLAPNDDDDDDDDETDTNTYTIGKSRDKMSIDGHSTTGRGNLPSPGTLRVMPFTSSPANHTGTRSRYSSLPVVDEFSSDPALVHAPMRAVTSRLPTPEPHRSLDDHVTNRTSTFVELSSVSTPTLLPRTRRTRTASPPPNIHDDHDSDLVNSNDSLFHDHAQRRQQQRTANSDSLNILPNIPSYPSSEAGATSSSNTGHWGTLETTIEDDSVGEGSSNTGAQIMVAPSRGDLKLLRERESMARFSVQNTHVARSPSSPPDQLGNTQFIPEELPEYTILTT